MKKRIKNLCILICILLAFTGLTACTNQKNEQDSSADNKMDSTMSSQTESTEVENTQADNQELKIDPQQLQEYYDFVSKTYNYMLAETRNENIAYAPINFYVSLSMLSEMTGDEARKELQEALGYSDLDKHAKETQNLVNFLKQRDTWNQDGTFGRLNLDNSLWLRDTLDYQKTIVDKLQKEYDPEIFEGDFNNSEFQKKMTDWVYEKTNHVIQPQFSELISSPEENAFSIIGTLDFMGMWAKPFEEENTEKGIFYCNDGTQAECEFMNSEDEAYDSHGYLKGDGYISTALSMSTKEKMIFILPDETEDIYDFWNGNHLTDILSAWENDEYSMASLKLSVPKFHCSNKIDLAAVAEKMKITQVFDPNSEAFVPFSDAPLYLGDMKQETGVSIDEKGCSVASYTAIAGMGAEPKEYEKVEICLNRPFYYVICKEGVPFLIGFIDNPAE